MSTPRWIVIVAAITLLAVFSWKLVAIAVISVGCFAAYNRWRTPSPASSKCLQCGELMKSTQRWCKSCGSASWTRN